MPRSIKKQPKIQGPDHRLALGIKGGGGSTNRPCVITARDLTDAECGWRPLPHLATQTFFYRYQKKLLLEGGYHYIACPLSTKAKRLGKIHTDCYNEQGSQNTLDGFAARGQLPQSAYQGLAKIDAKPALGKPTMDQRPER